MSLPPYRDVVNVAFCLATAVHLEVTAFSWFISCPGRFHRLKGSSCGRPTAALAASFNPAREFISLQEYEVTFSSKEATLNSHSYGIFNGICI
jgi:hypothetical protein